MAIVDVGNMPGANLKAYMMLPIRILVFSLFFSIMYPMFLILGFLRALYLRIVIGPPSKILKYGTYPYPNTSGAGRPTHKAATHYPAQFLYDKPLDEAKLRAALLNLTAEDGIAADEVELTFKEEKPNDWPTSGSYDVTSALLPSFKKGYSYINKLFGPPFGEAAGYKEKIKIFVYNNDPGKPTVMHYGGSAEGWDGSSNYNFVKELMRRYAGLPPKAVFAKPEISAEGAAKFDEASFLLFLLKMPFNVFMNVRGAVWNMIRAATWAGGNEAFAPKIVAMNFTNEESEKLTKGCKKVRGQPHELLNAFRTPRRALPCISLTIASSRPCCSLVRAPSPPSRSLPRRRCARSLALPSPPSATRPRSRRASTRSRARAKSAISWAIGSLASSQRCRVTSPSRAPRPTTRR